MLLHNSNRNMAFAVILLNEKRLYNLLELRYEFAPGHKTFPTLHTRSTLDN